MKVKDPTWIESVIASGGGLFTVCGMSILVMILNPLRYPLFFNISVFIWLPIGAISLLIAYFLSKKQFAANKKKVRVCNWIIMFCGVFSLIWGLTVAAPWILTLEAVELNIEAAITSGIVTFGGAPLLIIGGLLSWKYRDTSKG